MGISVELGPVQETLLIPLLGRAEETRRRNGLLRDPKAIEIVEALDYDFDKWRGGASTRGACLRTRMIDEDVEAFLAAHPEGTVVELGCGLNTRMDRVDNGRVRWFDVDLPDVIALRRQFFEERDRCTIIAGSVLDDAWLEPVAATGGPWCVLSEAVFLYLEEPQVRQVVAAIAGRLPGAWLVTDTAPTKMRDGQATHDAMRHLPKESWFRWACDDPESLQDWGLGLKLERSRSFFDAGPTLVAKFPLVYRLAAKLPAFTTRSIRGYRLNRFVVLAGGQR